MRDKVSKELSAKITHLSALMTLFVVFIHYSSMCENYCGTHRKGFLAMVDYFGQGLTRNAVPLFFIISGILAFWNADQKNGGGGAGSRRKEKDPDIRSSVCDLELCCFRIFHRFGILQHGIHTVHIPHLHSEMLV